jgi:ferredoxin
MRLLRFAGRALLVALAAAWLVGERGQLMRRSTWESLKIYGWRSIFDLTALHAYIYSRWTNLYIGLVINRLLPLARLPYFGGRGGQSWADNYHGKVLTTGLARAIITLEKDIPLQDLEQVVPFPVARDIVLSAAPDVAAYECACRHARESPCQPTQVCMVVGQPFVDFVIDHHPHTSRRLTQAEALDLLQAEHERGHIHVAYFKDAMLGRFYAICNCCSCCCGGISAMVDYGVPILAASGYVAQVDGARCAGCGMCEDVCPFGAVEVDGAATIDWTACMGCGVCAGQCPNEAVTLVLDAGKGVPMDVRELVEVQA